MLKYLVQSYKVPGPGLRLKPVPSSEAHPRVTVRALGHRGQKLTLTIITKG